jgi:hypothetical protein
MELFKSLRIIMGNNSLNKRALKVRRNREFINLNNAGKIGVVWDIVRQEDLTPISDFILLMNERGIKVEVIGIFQNKQLPDKLTALRYITCLKKEDLSFSFLPKAAESEKFIKTTYDLLIEISFRDTLPVRFISTLTPARCRISTETGRGFNRDYADMLISTGQNSDVREYLKQVVSYLEIINGKVN